MKDIQYYKTYEIKVKISTSMGDIEFNKKTAWPSRNDNGELIWTLCEDYSTIIPDKYVIEYKLL